MFDTDFDEINGNREIEPNRYFCQNCQAWRYDEESDHRCHACGFTLINIVVGD